MSPASACTTPSPAQRVSERRPEHHRKRPPCGTVRNVRRQPCTNNMAASVTTGPSRKYDVRHFNGEGEP